MTIEEVYKYCLDVSNKDVHGLAFSAEQFNNTIKFVNMELFLNAFSKAKATSEQGGKKLADVLWETDDLKNFIEVDALPDGNIYDVNGMRYARTPYPSGMEYVLSLWTDGRDVEIVSPFKLRRLRSSMATRNFDERPIAIITDDEIEYYPNDITNLTLTYLKKPTDPYYDWCIDSNDIQLFMPVGSYIRYVLQTGTYNLYERDRNNNNVEVLLAFDVTHEYFQNVTPNPNLIYDSLSTEIEWSDTMHLTIANRVLERMAVNLRWPEGAQYAMNKQ